MKYSLLCVVIVGILAIELSPNDYDYYRIQLDANQVGSSDLFITVNTIFDSITMRCDSNSELFGTVENTNQIIIYYKERVRIGCSNTEFALGLTYNTEIKTINVQVYGLDDYIQFADNNYTNQRYKTPNEKLVNNQYTIGYKDETFSIKTTSRNIYVEMFTCKIAWLYFDQLKEDGTKRSIRSDSYNFYDVLNATTANYQVTGSYDSDSVTPQYIIKYQQYSQDKTVPYDKIYAYSSYLSYSQQDETLKFQLPGVYTSISYTTIQYFIILGSSSDEEYINCYLADRYSNRAQITYYYGSDNQSPEITVYYPDKSYDYAVAFAQITVNGVTVTKKLGSTYFYYKYKTNIVFLPILISLIGIMVIIFAVIRYRMKLKQIQNSQQPLIQPDPQPQQVVNQQSYLINN